MLKQNIQLVGSIKNLWNKHNNLLMYKNESYISVVFITSLFSKQHFNVRNAPPAITTACASCKYSPFCAQAFCESKAEYIQEHQKWTKPLRWRNGIQIFFLMENVVRILYYTWFVYESSHLKFNFRSLSLHSTYIKSKWLFSKLFKHTLHQFCISKRTKQLQIENKRFVLKSKWNFLIFKWCQNQLCTWT